METTLPEFYCNLTKDKTVELDVRKNLSEGNDPFHVIMDGISKLPDGSTLKLITTFEPKPLISILRQKGYATHVVYEEGTELVFTFFKKESAENNSLKTDVNANPSKKEQIEDLLKSYGNKIKTLDVRDLEMPLPMVTILKELEHLAKDVLLYVNHKKVPEFLLPELQERGYKWLIEEIEEGNIKLLIYKLVR